MIRRMKHTMNCVLRERCQVSIINFISFILAATLGDIMIEFSQGCVTCTYAIKASDTAKANQPIVLRFPLNWQEFVSTTCHK